MATISTNITGLTDPGLAAAFSAGFASAAAPLGMFASVFPWDKGSYDAAFYTPVSGYSAIAQSAEINPEDLDQEDTLSITSAEYALGYAMSMTAFRTVPRSVLVQSFTRLGALVVRFFESQIGDKLNNAEGTTVTADGVALGSASHTSAVGNQSNLVNGNLSATNLQTAIQMLRDQTDSRGVKQSGSPTHLLGGSDNEVLIKQLVGGTHFSDSLADENVYRGQFAGVISSDMDTNVWHLFDITQWMSHGGVMMPVVRGPNPKEIMEEEDTYNYKVTDRMSLGIGIPGWRGLVVGQSG